MIILNKKYFHIILVLAFISIVVIFLYPTGNNLLIKLRTRDSSLKYGQEIIYSYINGGDIRIADQILENKYEISRFEPVVIDNQNWTEDPFSDIYWRFNYYNLEPVRNLLFAWQKNNKEVYKDKLISITESFIYKGIDGPYSWDYHGAAFRTMTLINVREKLRQKGELPLELDNKILETIKMHGDFLADPAHFEKEYNHGIDQAAALYLLAVNFPDLPESNNWLNLSSERIITMLNTVVDDDGVLVENSPYYHLYVLEKFLEINKYLKQNHLFISGFSEEKIDKMISYVVYVLQPDLSVPTIGASIKRQINLYGLYEEMATSHPELLYVLTQGERGQEPAKLNIQYPVSGETIMRSGWNRGDDYVKQTQLIFDVGNYRTNHSDLDALSFSLYSQGLALMPDAGLYSYEIGPYRSYFHGTRAHNTVVVDNRDQNIGNESKKVSAGFFDQRDGYVYQSAQHILYDGVTHKRAMVLIEDSTVLILDDLESSSEHTYEQMFHLFPGAQINSDDLTLKAKGSLSEQSLTIQQFITNGLELQTAIDAKNPLDGLCSFEYKVAVPCQAISYKQKGKNVSYVTAISLGTNLDDIKFDQDSKLLTVTTKNNIYSFKINKTKNIERVIEVNKKIKTSSLYSNLTPVPSLNLLTGWEAYNEIYDNNIENYGSSVVVNKQEKSLQMTTPTDGTFLSLSKDIVLDLSKQNLYFKIKVDKTVNLQGLDFYLSNDNWAKYAVFYIKGSAYDVNRDGEWLQFGVGKGDLRKIELGNWFKSDSTFDWAKIDSLKIVAKSNQGKNVTLNIKDFYLAPDQKEARAIIVFDDGWDSVMAGADLMNKYNFKGNVAVITNSIGKNKYLTLDNLKILQNNYGWNIVSHSSLHKDAVETYGKVKLQEYETDIGDALQYLIQNGLNSAPNWYIYPDGRTNGPLKTIINKYYKFARATTYVPQVFPFAEPLEIGVFPIYSDRTQLVDVHNSLSDALKYKQTIILMFHKLSEGSPSVYTEYSLSDFGKILKDIKNQGIKVVTLSEFDQEFNVPQTDFILHEAIPGQLKLDISVSQLSEKPEGAIIKTWKNFINFIKKIIQSLKFF